MKLERLWVALVMYCFNLLFKSIYSVSAYVSIEVKEEFVNHNRRRTGCMGNV